MTNILYIGAHPTTGLMRESGGRIDSLYRDGQAFVYGFRSVKEVNFKVITSPDIASYPKNNLFYKSYYDREDDTLMVSSLNVDILKFYWTVLSMTRAARQIIRKNEGKTTVVIPYMLFRHVLTVSLIKLLSGKKVDVCILIPDVFFPKKRFARFVNGMAERMTKRFTYFVLYTDAMADYLQIRNKKHIVIEGFHKVEIRPIETPKDKFVITYAGCLEIRFGIGRLLDAFKMLDYQDMELHLYGYGDADRMIRERASDDNRIIYHGCVSKDEATAALYKSSLLVNPRNDKDGEFVQYSFPSKDIDYFASGVPCVLCKLPGMPKEYYGYFIDANDGSVESLAASVEIAYAMSETQRYEMGQRARQFIMERMDTNRQAIRILEMING